MMRNFLFWLQAFASSVKNPLLCRLLTSAQSPNGLLQGALPPKGGCKVEQISPGMSMIFTLGILASLYYLWDIRRGNLDKGKR